MMWHFESSRSVFKLNPSLSASGEHLKKTQDVYIPDPRPADSWHTGKLRRGLWFNGDWANRFSFCCGCKNHLLRTTMPPQKTDTRMSEDVVTMVYMTEYRLLLMAHVTDVQVGRRFMQSLIISFPQRWRNSHSTNICRCRTFGKWCRRQMAISPTWLLPNKDTGAW